MSKYVGITIAAGILVLLILTPSTVKASNIYQVADLLIEQFEGFSATPYWDVTRYSWGYGTPAPSDGSGVITPAEAVLELQKYVLANYNELAPQLTRKLTKNQWAALSSFAYNEGDGAAQLLVPDINAGDDNVLETHWKKYIYANHVVNDTLVDRRNREWEVWQS